MTTTTPPAVACLDDEDVVRLVETLRTIRGTAQDELNGSRKENVYFLLDLFVQLANEALAPYEEAQP